MSTQTNHWLATITALVAIWLAATSCSTEDASSGTSPTTASAESADAETTTANEAEGDAPDGDATTTPQPDPEPQVFELIITQATSPGPRPMLAWDSIDGATSYDLIVLDAEGTPYWAWSGEAAGVHLGGVENPDAVGAWVFEPLTWIVTARDNEGQPLAMSAAAELLP